MLIANSTINPFVDSLLYTGLGLVLFAFALLVASWLAPFSLHKEIEEDQNVAVGVMLGAMFIGIAIIVAAAIG